MSTQAFSLKTRKPIADEDALLTEEDRQQKTTAPRADCTTRKRACKNCVCGRAELEAKGIYDYNQQQLPPGGCGNCAKGDAFRCANCPYLGQPAFDNTEDGKVKLNLTDDI